MCKRNSPDPLARIFLERYRMNLLAVPGNRVKCGSVYIKRDRHVTAPGQLSELVEPELHLPPAFAESDLPEFGGVWSSKVSARVAIGLLKSFLVAIGAGGMVDNLKASVERNRAQAVSFRFDQTERESLDPASLGTALAQHKFRSHHPWVRPGNSYFVTAAVIRSPSITICAHDQRDNTIDLAADITSVVDVDAKVSVAHGEDHELTYAGSQPLAFAVELYQLSWDDDRETLVFDTPNGPLPVLGFAPGESQASVFIGDDDEAFIAVTE